MFPRVQIPTSFGCQQLPSAFSFERLCLEEDSGSGGNCYFFKLREHAFSCCNS